MARPLKNNADYFPHDSDLRNDRRCKALRTRFGPEGYGIFNMLLEALAHAEHFEIPYSTLEMELLAGDFDVQAEKLEAVIQYVLDVELLDQKDQRLSSPLLADLKQILAETREKERKRKTSGKSKQTDVFQPENGQQNRDGNVLQKENSKQEMVFRAENTQSKVIKSINFNQADKN